MKADQVWLEFVKNIPEDGRGSRFQLRYTIKEKVITTTPPPTKAPSGYYFFILKVEFFQLYYLERPVPTDSIGCS